MENLEIRKHQFAKFARNSGLKHGTQKYMLAQCAFFSGVLVEHHGHTGNMPPSLTIPLFVGRGFLTRQEQHELEVKTLPGETEK